MGPAVGDAATWYEKAQWTGLLITPESEGFYEDCKKRMAEKKFDKQLFLDLEEAWQVYVKVGVAGLRTKSMIDDDLKRAS